MSIYQKITALFTKKQEIDNKITTMQKSCNHLKKSVKQVRERGDSTSPVIRWVCDDCFRLVGYPNKQETDKFFRE